MTKWPKVVPTPKIDTKLGPMNTSNFTVYETKQGLKSNARSEGDTTVPFGGVKASGNGRDKSLHALEKYTDIKNVLIRL